MTKKNLWLLAALIALTTVYICFFTNWFKPKTIRIFSTTQPIRHFEPRHGRPFVLFGLTSKFQLTEVKVVPLAEWQANPETLPVWHLISASNSAPVEQFFYGEHIHGMKPAIAGVHPEKLQTNVTYRLFLAAGKTTGWHDFEIK
jgi:hypothetical protein